MTPKYEVRHIRGPIVAKSDNWQDTADHWRVIIGGQTFDYYTGSGLRKKLPFDITKPVAPLYDDVLRCLLTEAEAAEMSFTEWCGCLGYDEDSLKALKLYMSCQEIEGKLRKAGVNIHAERDRLNDEE